MRETTWLRVCEVLDECVLYRFSRVFTLEKGCIFKASVCADSRYKLYVNGMFVVEGPCHGTAYKRFYETVDLTPYLKEGENVVYADVLHVAAGHYISVFREDKAAFWIEGCITHPSGEKETVTADKSWTVGRFLNRKMYSYPGFIPSVPPSEEVNGSDIFTPVETFLYSQAAPEYESFNMFGVRGIYPLAPRPIPNLKPGAAKPMIEVKRDKKGVDYDAGQYETAYVHLTVTAEAGTEIKLIYAESKVLFDENGKPYKHLRDDPDGVVQGSGVNGGLCDILRFTEDGTLTFSTFYFRAFRYIRLESNRPYTLDHFTFAPYYYPMGEEGKVTCSDPLYNRLWDVSRHTALCCAHDNYVDCPYYEQQQYDMDSGLQMLFTLRMTGDTALPKKSISDLAASQLPDGMIQANYPSVVVQVIPSFSLYWVLMLREYIRYTADFAFAKEMIGTAEKVLSCFASLLDEKGLVGTTNYWPFVDWVAEWVKPDIEDGVCAGGRDEPLTMYTMIYVVALKAMAELCVSLGKKGQAEDYLAQADAAILALNTHCFDPNYQMYRNTPYRNDFSQHTALWAVLSGAITGDEAVALMRKAMTEPLYRTSFSMNYYLFRALEMTGLYDEFAPLVFEGWKTMLDWHCTTWCENPACPRSECHAWSSTPIFEMSSAILGVYPTADGMTDIRVSPRLGWFDDMQGTVPTPYGLVYVGWTTKEGKKTLTVKNPAPEHIKLTVCLDGKEMTQSEAQKTYYIE
ncbi:MAG: hypothetical protein J6R42_05125 [Clostridia bacterium]|nr:hypothetical protein [Clostridia bacterium]